MNCGPHSIWSQLAVPVEFRKDITVWGIIQPSAHMLYFLIFIFFAQNVFQNSFPIGNTEKKVLFKNSVSTFL